MYINIQSLGSKVTEVALVCKTNSIDIICVCEHWANENQILFFCIDGYKLISSYCRINRIHGGTAVFIREGLPYEINQLTITQYIQDINLEYSGIVISCGKAKKVCILSIYRSPSGSVDVFLTNMSLLLSQISLTCEIVLCGDFNIDSLDRNNFNYKSLNDLLAAFQLTNIINSPTRIMTNKNNVTTSSAIDYVASCSDVIAIHSVQIRNIHLSDHMAIFFNCPLPGMPQGNTNNHSYKYRKITRYNLQLFRTYLDDKQWIPCENKNIHENFQNFVDLFLLGYNQYCPIQTCIPAKYWSNPWYTKDLRKLRDELHVAYQMYKETCLSSLKKAYNLKRKHYRKCINTAKRMYLSNKISQSSNKIKQTWFEVNRKLGRSTDGCRIHSIRLPNGTVSSDNSEIADCFGAHFSVSVKQKITDVFSGQDKNSCTTTELVDVTFYCEPVTPQEVLSIINNLKNTSSSGADDILVRVLKSVGEAVAEPLSSLINLSFLTGAFPDVLKVGKVTAIFKKGDAEDCDNYRPICVLSCFSKVLEKAMYSRISSYLSVNNILSNSQHGFRSGRSTETAVVEFVNFLSKKMDEGRPAAGVFFDLSKAFDSINIEFVKSKFYHLGIRGVMLDWIVSFLSDRTIFTCINGCNSGDCGLDLGVPQGSILGPLVFILFINDLPRHISKGLLINYADDTSIALSESSFGELQESITTVCREFQDWCRKNRLILNLDKTYTVVFSRLQMPSDITLNSSSEVRFLGLLLDQSMSWSAHIDLVCTKLNRAYFAILQLRYDLDGSTLLQVYYALVYSAISYHIIVWGGAINTRRVFLIQKRIIRLMFNIKKRSSCRTIFKENRILTFCGIYILKCCLYVRCNMRLFNNNSSNHNYSTRNGEKLLPPQHRTAAYQRSAYYNCIKVYNNIPSEIRALNSLGKYKSSLKKYLHSHCFYTLTEFFSHNN